MGVKGGKKGGRTVSKVKRSNQRMNKMVKQGKAKPKSKPRYIPNAKNKKSGEQSEKEAWLTPELRAQWARSQEEDADAALEQLAEEVRAGQDGQQLAARLKRRLDSEGEGSEGEEEAALGELERGALARLQRERETEVKVRGLLPIKTKLGVKQRLEEVEQAEETSDREEEPGEGENSEDKCSSEDEHEDMDVVRGKEVSVVELYAKRKEILADRKLTIGSLASNFLEAPEERVINLEKLVRLVDSEQPGPVEMTVHRLAAASVLEILKDVTPAYKIKHQELKEGEKLKKDTLRLVKYENAFLKCYKNYLLKLEKLVNQIKSRERLDETRQKQAGYFLSCMCQLLVAHPHFNFATNILHAVIPLLSNADESCRKMVKNSLQEVFKGDMKGEISWEAVKLINHLVKSRKHNVRPDVISVLLNLRIKDVDLDKEKNAELELKKKEAQKKKLLAKKSESKQEKKRRKKLEVLEKELLEARGEEGKKVKEKFFTETTKLVFTIYFRILKSFPKSSLMTAVLEGLSKFSHVINIEFFSDLISVFQSLLSGGTLSYQDTLLATGTVFRILSGQGESLNIDPASFYTHLYTTLFSLSAVSATSTLPLALAALHDMLVGRKKKVSRGRVLAFAKRVGSLALAQDHSGSAGCLALLRGLHTAHPALLGQLLDTEHEVGSGVFDPSLQDPEHCCASNTTAWELTLLGRHYHPVSQQLSRHLVAGCPTTGEHGLGSELKQRPEQLCEQFSLESGVFNPAVPPPAKKAKRGASSALSPEFTAEPGPAAPPPQLDFALNLFSA